jgi:hypothetical protein
VGRVGLSVAGEDVGSEGAAWMVGAVVGPGRRVDPPVVRVGGREVRAGEGARKSPWWVRAEVQSPLSKSHSGGSHA